MKSYTFTGTVELGGVIFFVTAENEEDAKAKAKAGDYDHYDAEQAETYNSEIRLSTCTLNE